MKIIPSILFSLLAAGLAGYAQTLDVHEWGTFTTLSGSDGKRLGGLVREEEFLPGFVYQHDRYHPTFRNKGFGLRTLQNVTVKMETPVVYFYAARETSVNLRVDFPNGCISQWYPDRTDGEALLDKDTIDFATPFRGWIDWSATVLAPGAADKYSADPSMVTKTWSAPRATDANLVRASARSEVESYLFYRGLGNFEMPLSASFGTDGSMNIGNGGPSGIPYVFVYHLRDSSVLDAGGKVVQTIPVASVWWTGKLEAGVTMNMNVNATYAPLDSPAIQSKLAEFAIALKDAGLYSKEADAMLATWSASYFHQNGLKVFWIVPRDFTDKTIPMRIAPVPNSLQRVLVGRSEVLTPDFEKQLFKDLVTDNNQQKWQNDRYYYAYKQRVGVMGTSGAVPPEANRAGVRIFPNPARRRCTVQMLAPGDLPMHVTVSNALGVRMLGTTVTSGKATLDVSGLPAGTYMVQITCDDKIWVRSLAKE